MSTPSIEPPSTPRKQLSRDERIRIRTLRDVGWSYQAIADKYKHTYGAVQWACSHAQTPVKRPGRPSKLSAEQIEALVEFVVASKVNRRLPYYRLPSLLGFECGTDSVHYALRKAGFKRCLARNKPPISEKNRQARLAWALEHKDWNQDQ